MRNGRSRSSMSLVSRWADRASVRAMRTVGTSITSWASRAALSARMNCEVGTSTLPPMCPHFFSLASWSSKWTPDRAGLDHRLHDLEGVERAAEAGLGVGDDRGEVVAIAASLGVLDLVGPAEGVVDGPHQRRGAVAGIEALVGIHLAGEVGVGRDLPAAQVDRLQPGLDHLDGLVAGHGTQRVDIGFGMQELPEPLRASSRQGALDVDRAAQPDDILGRIVPPVPFPAWVALPTFAQLFGCGWTIELHGQSLPIDCGAIDDTVSDRGGGTRTVACLTRPASASSDNQGRCSYAGSVRNSTKVGLVVTWSKI